MLTLKGVHPKIREGPKMGFRTSKIAILGSILKNSKNVPNRIKTSENAFFRVKNLKMGTSRGGVPPPSFTYWGFTYWGGGVCT